MKLKKILTPSGFAAVFYSSGKKTGAFIADLFLQRYKLKGEKSILALAQAVKAIGWGQIEDFKVDPKRPYATVKIRRCFEAVLRGNRREKVCHWTRGFVAGFLGKVLGMNLEGVEVKCAAAGDELCEFEVRTRI